MALLIFMVSLENQRTAQTSGVLSKIREKSKTHRNVPKPGDILDAEIKVTPFTVSPVSDLHLFLYRRYEQNRESLDRCEEYVLRNMWLRNTGLSST